MTCEHQWLENFSSCLMIISKFKRNSCILEWEPFYPNNFYFVNADAFLFNIGFRMILSKNKTANRHLKYI